MFLALRDGRGEDQHAQAVQKRRLEKLGQTLEFFDAVPRALPREISLPDKDVPIFLAAMAARSTHLITGDVRHFGRYFGETIESILVLSPAEYLRMLGS